MSSVNFGSSLASNMAILRQLASELLPQTYLRGKRWEALLSY